MDKHLPANVATWALMDSSGNLIESFDDADVARQSLREILQADPANTKHVALIGFDADGDPISPIETARRPAV
jgi:hypothetical protein